MASIVKVQAILNGQTYNLTKGSGDEWTAAPSAPTQTSGSNNAGIGPGVGAEAAGKGYYPVKIVVTDDYGNSSEYTSEDPRWGEVLRLKVIEKTAPVATLQYPNDGALIKSSKPTIQFKVADSGAGPKATECYVDLDGTVTKVTGTVSGSECTVSYEVPSKLDDGDHTLNVYGFDYDGNKSNVVSAAFKVDTTPPVLNITSPESETTKVNKTVIKVIGTTNDEVSSPVTIRITGGVREYVVDVSAGSFSQDVELRDGATNVLTITATDAAELTTVVTRTVIVNTIPPEITNIKLVPNPVDGGKTLAISVTARSGA